MNLVRFALLFLSVSLASAATVYVRDGGTGTGAAWDNALDQLPYPLVRGDTYYLAAGTYNGQVYPNPVQTARSGTTLITIKKATVSDHGTETGWQASYADGQAVLGPMAFMEDTGYITVDGQYAYGIRINVALGNNTFGLNIRNDSADSDTSIPNMTFRYLEIVGPADDSPDFMYDAEESPRGILVNAGIGGPYPNLTISHCSVRGCIDTLYLSQVHDLVVEYTELAWSSSGNGAAHENVVYISNSTGCTWRNNLFRDWDVEGILLSGYGHNWKVYGNVFDGRTGTGTLARAIELYGGGTYTNHVYVNNTFVDLDLVAIRVEGTASGLVSSNNLFYNCATFYMDSGGAITRNHNWYEGASAQSESNSIAGGSTNPFVSYATSNFRLAAPLAGASLASEFNTDPDGNTRGSDGTWDIGAYEYGGTPPIDPPASGNGSARVTNARVGTLIFR